MQRFENINRRLEQLVSTAIPSKEVYLKDNEAEGRYFPIIVADNSRMPGCAVVIKDEIFMKYGLKNYTFEHSIGSIFLMFFE